jgi:hypothetical protein
MLPEFTGLARTTESYDAKCVGRFLLLGNACTAPALHNWNTPDLQSFRAESHGRLYLFAAPRLAFFATIGTPACH